jgi:hypothetical protein
MNGLMTPLMQYKLHISSPQHKGACDGNHTTIKTYSVACAVGPIEWILKGKTLHLLLYPKSQIQFFISILNDKNYSKFHIFQTLGLKIMKLSS